MQHTETIPELLLRFSIWFFFFPPLLLCRQLNLPALSLLPAHRGDGHNSALNRRALMHTAPAKANETHL